MKVRPSFWSFVAICVLCILGVFMTQDVIFYELFYLSIFIMLVSWVWAYYSVKGIGINRFSRVSRHQVGQIFDETIEVDNHLGLLRHWLEVKDQEPLPGSSGVRVLSWISGRTKRAYSIYTMLIQRGQFSLGPTYLRSGDPLGLFTSTKLIPGERTLLVLPYSVDLNRFPGPPGLLPGGRALRRKSLEVTPHASGVREYVQGDSLNRIHWASSAKRDKLMVKEFDQDPQADIWIFLDSYYLTNVVSDEVVTVPNAGFRWYWWNKRDEFHLFPSTYEYSVSAAASVMRYYIRQGQSVGLASAGQVFVSLSAERGERQLAKTMETLAFLRPEGNIPLQGLVEMQSGHLTRGSTVVLVTAAAREDLILAVDELYMRDLRPVVVLIEPRSFGGSLFSDAILSKLYLRGVPVRVVAKDKNLKEALEREYVIPRFMN